MPRHRGSENQVSLFHRNLLTFYDSVDSTPFQYEPKRREIVPVILGHLPGFQKLHGHEHRVGHGALSSVLVSLIGGIDESQHASFRLAAEAVHLCYRLNHIVEILPLPDMSQDRRISLLALMVAIR